MTEFAWPAGKTAAAAITVDVDAESGMLFEHPDSAAYLNLMSHQAYDPQVGVPRLLDVLQRHGVRGTFFVPGFTADRWPDAVRQILDAGHEVGHHGYLHEPLYGLDEQTEEDYLQRGLEALARVGVDRPAGFRAPKFRLSYRTPALLAKHGFRYDSSLMDADRPYALAAAPLVEIPVYWPLDDWVHYSFLPSFVPSTSVQRPGAVLDLWREEFDGYADVGGCFVLTLHPPLSGRPARARVVERLIEHIRARGDVWLTSLEEIAAHAAGLGLEPVTHVPPVHPYV